MKLKDLKELWAEELTRTSKREDSTLVFTRIFRIKGWPTSFPTIEGSTLSGSSEMTNCFWDFAVLLFLASRPTSVHLTLSSSSALLTASYLIFFSLPIPTGAIAPISSITPLLIGSPEKVPTIRSHPNQVSGKSFA